MASLNSVTAALKITGADPLNIPNSVKLCLEF